MEEVASWWCVAWRWQGRAWEVDLTDREEAQLFARRLAEDGREEVLVTPIALDDDPERHERIWGRLVARLRADAAEEQARASQRVRELESRLRMYEGTRPPRGVA